MSSRVNSHRKKASSGQGRKLGEEKTSRSTLRLSILLLVLVAAGATASIALRVFWPGGGGPVRPAVAPGQPPLQRPAGASPERTAPPAAGLHFLSPEEGTLYPPELPPPRFSWEDATPGAVRWLVSLTLPTGEAVRQPSGTRERSWRPSEQDWRGLAAAGPNRSAMLTVVGQDDHEPPRPLSSGQVRFAVSGDPVGAPIFYREVPLPFREAYTHMDAIRWRLGDVSSRQQPPVVLEHLPVCGNCHSFSRDGRVLGMDVDYADDKGAYVIAEVQPLIRLSRDKIISWNDFRRKDGVRTFGLLSQVSPDGRYVVSTLKDRSLFIPLNDLWFSQLFFPVKGILVAYDRVTKSFASLPGADDPDYVQSNPSWSPDGQAITFARAPVQRAVLEKIGDASEPVLNDSSLQEEKYRIRYDLFRVPFNGGRGGKAEPIPGASANGKSNFFARTSPDGKWIVFCQSRSAMLLQPDSQLYIMPASGGTPRRLRCNGERMNSWHSWSPAGRWLVFASKRNSPYTQLFLTHIDEEGQDSPAVLLEQFTAPERAANIPEFAPLRPGTPLTLREAFVDDGSHARLGTLIAAFGDLGRSRQEFEQALTLNPRNKDARLHLGLLEVGAKDFAAADRSFETVLSLGPTAVEAAAAHHGLGAVRFLQGDVVAAEAELRTSLRSDPTNEGVLFTLARLLLETNRPAEAIPPYVEGLRLHPARAAEHGSLAEAYLQTGDYARALEQYRRQLQLQPDDPGAQAMVRRLEGSLQARGAPQPR